MKREKEVYMANVLIIDDDRAVGEIIFSVVSRMNCNAIWAPSISEAQARIKEQPFDLAFLDIRLPDGDGLSFLSAFNQKYPNSEVIVMTGFGDPDSAERAIKCGAFDYLQKPITLDELQHSLTTALAYTEELKHREDVHPLSAMDRRNIIGNSAPLMACLEKVADAAATEITILIYGETGTGKERFAEAVHNNSLRRGKPLVVVDCASLLKSLVESELFGYEKGAFTGADHAKEGLVKQADGGSLFLDEIGEMPLDVQKKFLRVLQERSFRPVGSKQVQRSDFRLIAATNRNLVEMTAHGRFREDLLFRLKAMTIELPPLRHRKEDLRPLAEHFLTVICNRYRIRGKGFSDDFFDMLAAYDWPGNIRELYQVMESTVINAQGQTRIFAQDLPSDIRINVVKESVATTNRCDDLSDTEIWGDITFPKTLPPIKEFRERALDALSREYAKEILRRTGGNMEEACRISGLSRSRIYAFIKKYGPRKKRTLASSDDTII
jgi:two-component system, NtrC family, response regulator